MGTRHLTTAVTLVVLSAILVIGAVVGYQQLSAPLPGGDEPAAAPTASESCAVEPVERGRRLRSDQVVVNVFNAGDRAGLAGQVMDALRARDFQGGQIGNAPRGSSVPRVQVWVEQGEQDAGRLVARHFGPRTPVLTRQQDLADGIDVVLGNGFRTLVRAPRSLKVTETVEGTCS